MRVCLDTSAYSRLIPTNDIWIAAAALETGARLVTYDAHFGKVQGLFILSP